MHWTTYRRDPAAVTARIVMPVASVLLSLLIVAVGGLVFTGQRSNELALERQRVNLAASLDAERWHVLRGLASTVMSPDAQKALSHPMSPEGAQRAIGEALERAYRFDMSFVLTPERLLVSGRIGGEPADQRRFEAVRPLFEPLLAAVEDQIGQAALRRDLDGPVQRTDTDLVAKAAGSSRIVFDGNTARIIAAVAVPSEINDSAFGRMLATVAIRLDSSMLSELSMRHAYDDLRLVEVSVAPGPASLAIPDETGQVRAHLVWTPETPGDLVLGNVLPTLCFALVAIGLFSLFMFRHVRVVTTDLVTREAEATHLANHDTLSGLPNRAFFAERLEGELARLEEGQEGVALLYMDLDRFKEINDGHGHAAGDLLIRIVAKRLTGILRGSDTLARFGGDEFAILQTGVRSAHDCASLAHRVLEVIREPIELHGTQVFVGISIGIALAPDNGRESDELMKQADVALYRAKHEGRNRYCFFELGMDETLRMRQIVEEDLRKAIDLGQLSLTYQPQFSADGRKILGVEALVRWEHPEHGLVSPADFVPIAEQRGVIGKLGEWVLRQACRDGRRWRNITLAINVSPIQFRQKEFVPTVARIVEEEGMDPTRVELELTEGVLVEDADAAESAMMDLRALGLRFALDDFGTGYSSLIYLRRFAFDKIKIDRSFLESMETTGESAILVHSVVHLGRALGLTVTAEGVETPEQQRFLQAVGCHQLQGFLFCRPVPAEKIDELLGLVEEDGTIRRSVA
jgi:diguanylate cyclase (GGDEF)-like protein